MTIEERALFNNNNINFLDRNSIGGEVSRQSKPPPPSLHLDPVGSLMLGADHLARMFAAGGGHPFAFAPPVVPPSSHHGPPHHPSHLMAAGGAAQAAALRHAAAAQAAVAAAHHFPPTSPHFGMESKIAATIPDSKMEAIDPLQNQLCRVCEEPAAGFHFGAFTCEGCKSFFGRTCNNQSVIQDCKNNYRCVVDKKNRTACKACRLRKCLMVGMSKSGSRYGRRSNWFKIHCLMQQNLSKAQQQQTPANGGLGPGSLHSSTSPSSSCSPPTPSSPSPMMGPHGPQPPTSSDFLRAAGGPLGPPPPPPFPPAGWPTGLTGHHHPSTSSPAAGAGLLSPLSLDSNPLLMHPLPLHPSAVSSQQPLLHSSSTNSRSSRSPSPTTTSSGLNISMSSTSSSSDERNLPHNRSGVGSLLNHHASHSPFLLLTTTTASNSSHSACKVTTAGKQSPLGHDGVKDKDVHLPERPGLSLRNMSTDSARVGSGHQPSDSSSDSAAAMMAAAAAFYGAQQQHLHSGTAPGLDSLATSTASSGLASMLNPSMAAALAPFYRLSPILAAAAAASNPFLANSLLLGLAGQSHQQHQSSHMNDVLKDHKALLGAFGDHPLARASVYEPKDSMVDAIKKESPVSMDEDTRRKDPIKEFSISRMVGHLDAEMTKPPIPTKLTSSFSSFSVKHLANIDDDEPKVAGSDKTEADDDDDEKVDVDDNIDVEDNDSVVDDDDDQQPPPAKMAKMDRRPSEDAAPEEDEERDENDNSSTENKMKPANNRVKPAGEIAMDLSVRNSSD